MYVCVVGDCLTMISLDGNNGMFPVAYYIGLSEDTLNWKKFLENMYPYVSRHPKPLTLMSDRQKRLIEVVTEVFPNSYQRFCFRHMVKNLRTMYRGVGGSHSMGCNCNIPKFTGQKKRVI